MELHRPVGLLRECSCVFLNLPHYGSISNNDICRSAVISRFLPLCERLDDRADKSSIAKHCPELFFSRSLIFATSWRNASSTQCTVSLDDWEVSWDKTWNSSVDPMIDAVCDLVRYITPPFGRWLRNDCVLTFLLQKYPYDTINKLLLFFPWSPLFISRSNARTTDKDHGVYWERKSSAKQLRDVLTRLACIQCRGRNFDHDLVLPLSPTGEWLRFGWSNTPPTPETPSPTGEDLPPGETLERYRYWNQCCYEDRFQRVILLPLGGPAPTGTGWRYAPKYLSEVRWLLFKLIKA